MAKKLGPIVASYRIRVTVRNPDGHLFEPLSGEDMATAVKAAVERDLGYLASVTVAVERTDR